MTSDITGHNDCIARFCKLSANRYAILNLADSRGSNKYTVHLSFSGDLRISGYNMYTSLFCRS